MKKHMYACALLMALFTLPASSIDMPDDLKIAEVMMLQWDKAENPLNVSPIVIAGSHAIAGWTQGSRGGRALVRQIDGLWQVYLCGGDDVLNTEFLKQAGMNDETAIALVNAMRESEQHLSANQRSQLSSFTGVVRVESSQHGHHH